MALLNIPAMTYESVGGLQTVLIRGGSLWSTSWSCELSWVEPAGLWWERWAHFGVFEVWGEWAQTHCSWGAITLGRVAPSFWVYPPYSLDVYERGLSPCCWWAGVLFGMAYETTQRSQPVGLSAAHKALSILSSWVELKSHNSSLQCLYCFPVNYLFVV